MPSFVLPIAALLLSTLFLLTGAGLSSILVQVRAGLEGWSPLTIGWIGTGYAIAFTAGCVYVPKMVLRVGHVRGFGALVTLYAISALLQGLIVDPVMWILVRAVAGFSLAGAYMVIESWLNETVTNETRGSVFSIYMMVSMAGLTAGQYILPLGEVSSTQLFMIAALLFGFAVLPTTLSSARSPQPLNQATLNLRKLYANSPAAVVGNVLAGILTGAWFSLGAVFGQAIGLSNVGIATMLAAATIGGVVLQYPLGWMSDRMDRRIVMTVAGGFGFAVAILAALLVPVSTAFIYPLCFMLGFVLFPIYALNVAHANDFAEPDEFVTISSGLLIVYGFGTMAGPLIAATMMQAVGPSGFFLTMAIMFALYGAYAFYRRTRRAAAEADDRVDFQSVPVGKTPTPQTFELDPRGVPETVQHQPDRFPGLWERLAARLTLRREDAA